MKLQIGKYYCNHEFAEFVFVFRQNPAIFRAMQCKKQKIIKSVATDFFYYFDYLSKIQDDVFGFMGFVRF